MTKEDITNKIVEIISEHSPEKIKIHSTRDSLGLDSLDKIEIIMAVEEEFDVEISDFEAKNLDTVGDLVNCVWGKVRGEKEPMYFRLKGYPENIIYSWEKGVVKNLGAKTNFDCTEKDFQHMIEVGQWILCNKDGSPLSEEECLKKLIDFSREDINNGRVGDISELKNKLSLKKKSAQKKKSKESQWTHTISERKFNRCVDQYCFNIQKDFSGKGLDIYYNPETNTVYRGIYNCKDEIVFVAKHLEKCSDPKIVNFYREMYESIGQFCKIVNNLGDNKYQVEGKIHIDKISGVLEESANRRFVEIPEDLKNGSGFVTIEDSRSKRETKTSHKSDGGKSKYYEVVFPDWLLKKHEEQGRVMLEDLAEVMFGNDFNYTNVFKAQKRMYDLENGGGKEGNTFEYDATKCKYYVDKQVEVFNRRVK